MVMFHSYVEVPEGSCVDGGIDPNLQLVMRKNMRMGPCSMAINHWAKWRSNPWNCCAARKRRPAVKLLRCFLPCDGGHLHFQ